MSAMPNILGTEDTANARGGVVWHRLHSEREDICKALLNESTQSDDVPAIEPAASKGTTPAADWHRELLQARLRKVDDALDRLMSGSYGECCKCGKWIEDPKLDFDPAIAYCLDCWGRMQTTH